MSLSTSPVFLSEELDGEEMLRDSPSIGLISKQASPCIFDVLNPDSTTDSLHASLLEDIDLDLQCEEDGVDASSDTGFGDILDHPLQIAYNLTGVAKETTGMVSREKITMPVAIKDASVIEQTSSKPLALICPSASSSNSIQMKLPLSVSDIHSTESIKVQTEMSLRRIVCHLCNVHFSSHETLLAHIKDKHIRKKEILLHECSICGESFSSKKCLTRHAKVHKEKKEDKVKTKKLNSHSESYPCESCSYIGKTATLLRVHRSAMHDPHRKIYSCNTCSFSCFQERTLTHHIARHEGDPKFACDQCGKLFLSMGILKRHAHTHSKTRAYVCSIPGCHRSFTIRSRLTDHVRLFHRKQQKSVLDKHLKPCSIFEGSFIVDNEDSVQRKDWVSNEVGELHNVTKVENNTILTPDLDPCDICVYDIVLYQDQSKHTQSRNSTGRNTLESETITNEVTSGVNSTFIPQRNFHSSPGSSQDLKRKKFRCTWENCNKAFRDNYNLRVHLCTHTGEMERACPYCRYRCVQKSAMDAHLKTHRNPKVDVKRKKKRAH